MNRLKELRLEKGNSLKEVADQVDLAESQLSYYENGKRQPRDEKTWEKLAEYYGVSVAYLMGMSNYRTEPNEVFVETTELFFNGITNLILNSEEKISGSIMDSVVCLTLAWEWVLDETNKKTLEVATDFNFASRVVSRIFIGDYSEDSSNTELTPEEKKDQYKKDRDKLIEILDKHAFRKINND